MCEPLRGQIQKTKNIFRREYHGKELEGFEIFHKESVKSAVEFYKRYRVMPHLLEEERPDIYKIWIKFAKKNGLNPYFANERFESYEFQCWLFDYCFGDVIKNA